MKKRGVVAIFLLAIIMISAYVLAATNTTSTAVSTPTGLSSSAQTDRVAKGYSCVENKLKEASIGFQDAVFGMMAVGSNSNAKSKIESERDSTGCWPKGSCTLRDTAQVGVAYKRAGEDVSSIDKWLSSKNVTPSELKWFLQIDITSKVLSSCTINDGSTDSKVKVGEDMKITGNPGTCLTLDQGGYLLRIKNNCANREFSISCDKDFVTTLLYQKNSGGTIFVPSETHSAGADTPVKEKVSAKCFGIGTSCDYEGTLWATFYLLKTGQNTDAYMPYLLALAGDNKKYFPETFLYALGGGDEQYNLIVQSQKQGKYWELTGTSYGKYYYTSLAMIALAGKSSLEFDAARNYILTSQATDGCWGTTKDSAFLLYSGWPKATGGGAGREVPSCISPMSCENKLDCISSSLIVQENYDCSSRGAGLICCSGAVPLPSCTQKKGEVCPIGQQCAGNSEKSSDGACCMSGGCAQVAEVVDDKCQPAGGTCRAACESGEEPQSYQCASASNSCCMPKSGSSLWIWIVLLLLLIGGATLAIVYKEKTKVYWFKFSEWLKTVFKKKPAGGMPATTVPRGPPVSSMPRQVMTPRGPVMPPTFRAGMPPARAPVRPTTPRDRDMEETLRKLKELGK